MTNAQKLKEHLRWALEELDRYVTIGGDGVARNRFEGQLVEGYVKPYSAAKNVLVKRSFQHGQQVWINFPNDPGVENGYVGNAMLLEFDDTEIDGPQWRAALPNEGGDAWFPENCISPLAVPPLPTTIPTDDGSPEKSMDRVASAFEYYAKSRRF